MANIIEFSTGYVEDGVLKLRDVRHLSQDRILDCPFSILVPDHYREGDGCLCSNADARREMIQDWGYTKRDFRNIPLID